MTFMEFLTRINVTPEKGQRVLIKVLLDGADPASLSGEELAIAMVMFGGVQHIPMEARTVLALLAGGRGGKTYFLSLFLLYKALTLDISRLAPGEKAFAAIVAPTLDLAQQDLNYIVGAVEGDDGLRKSIIRSTSSELVLLQRPKGKQVSIRTFAASRGGVSGRGKSLVSVLLSETCFFRDESTGVVNDEAIFKAASPRVIPGGVTMIESTPWVSAGLMFDTYKKNFGTPTTALVAHAPTTTLREDPYILSIVAREYARDPDNARVEFGAEWGGTSSSEFFTDEDMALLFSLDAPPEPPKDGYRIGAATDLAFVRNSATLCTLQRTDTKIYVDVLEERRPEPGIPLVPSDICSAFASQLKDAGAGSVVADGHYRETLREYTRKIQCALIDSCGPAERFTLLRTAVRSGEVAMWKGHPLANRLKKQLVGIRIARTPGGNVSVILPKGIDGSHGDVADVLARAVWGIKEYGGTRFTKVEDTMSAEEKAMENQLLKKSRTPEDDYDSPMTSEDHWWALPVQ